MLRLMHADVLRELARAGVYLEENGNVRLYHATDAQSAAAISAERSLRPRQPQDPAERQLRRGGGSVFLSSSPGIVADLGKVELYSLWKCRGPRGRRSFALIGATLRV